MLAQRAASDGPRWTRVMETTLNGFACCKGRSLLLGELSYSAERRSLSWSLGWRSPHALIDLAEMVLASLSGAIHRPLIILSDSKPHPA